MNAQKDITGSFVAAAWFPSPWPPVATIQLFSKLEDGCGVVVSTLVNGSIAIEVFAGGALVRRDEYQPLQLTGGGFGVISFTWTKEETRLLINGTALRFRSADDVPCIIKLSERARYREPVYLELSADAKLNRIERLFVETIKDIQSKLDDPSHYNLIRAAGMLRQLFLDGSRLIDQVNRYHRVRLRFEIVPFERELSIVPEFHWCRISPGPSFLASEVCDLDHFLHATCVFGEKHKFSVYDLIVCCSHVFGGVHSGSPSNNKESELLRLQEAILAGGESVVDSTLRDICDVALRGCVPLMEALFRTRGK